MRSFCSPDKVAQAPVQGFLVVPASGFKVLQILDLFAVGLSSVV